LRVGYGDRRTHPWRVGHRPRGRRGPHGGPPRRLARARTSRVPGTGGAGGARARAERRRDVPEGAGEAAPGAQEAARPEAAERPLTVVVHNPRTSTPREPVRCT